MKGKWFATVSSIVGSVATLVVLVYVLERTSSDVSGSALAASPAAAPTVLGVDPASAPNDLDTAIIITGSDFVSMPAVYLGGTPLGDVRWVSTTTLEATVPWGMDPGVYTVTVSNPGGESGSLPNGFTVAQGIGVVNAGEMYGGAVSQVAINPLTPTTVYAVSSHVGLFRSRDGGENWSFQFASTEMHNVTVNPVTPTTVYWDSYGRFYRSDDEGDTWTALTLEFTATQSWGSTEGGCTPQLAVHPTMPDTVYAFRCGEPPDEPGGLFKSTDRGDTWSPAMVNLTDTQVSALAFHPTDPMTMYVGTWNGNFFRSADGGESWGFVAQPMHSIMTLAVNPFGAHDVWATSSCLHMPPDTVRSTNPELTDWVSAIGPYASEGAASHIYFAPHAWGDTYSGTVFVSGFGTSPDLKTTDGGANWASFGPDLAISSTICYALHPADPNVIYVGEGANGVQKTDDGGATWRVVNRGLTAMYPYRMAPVPGQPGVVYALVSAEVDTFFKTTDGGESWDSLPVEPGSSTRRRCGLLVDPFTPTTVYVGLDTRPIYRSDDGGQTWAVSATLPIPEPYTHCLIAPHVLRADPVHPGALLAGMSAPCSYWTVNIGGIYSSTDRGESWHLIDLSQEISPVTDIAFDALTQTIVYLSTSYDDGGGMFRSTDSGQTWQPMGESIAALDHVQDIAVEPRSPYRVFVSAWAGLYISEDHGESWMQATSWPPSNVQQILCTHNEPSSVLYAATMDGLFRSVDGAQSWARAAGVLGRVPVYSLAEAVADERVALYAGTTGGVVPYIEEQASVAASAASSAVDNPVAAAVLVNAGVYRYTTLQSEAVPMQRGWVRVADDGFGEPESPFAAAPTVFDGQMYVGVANFGGGGAHIRRTADGQSWSQLAHPWFPTTTWLVDLEAFGPHLYVGTAQGEVWRTDGISWTRVISEGAGDGNNTEIGPFTVFSDTLYAATVNNATGVEVWRSETGAPGGWSQANEDGFGSAGTLGGAMMGVYSDTLYVGLNRSGLAELWRSGDGLVWTPVFTDGLVNPDNELASALVEFDGDFYLGMQNQSRGGELWRSSDGLHWTRVFASGLGNPDNVDPRALTVYGDALYLAFANWTTGVEIWRTADGDTWERINLNGWGESNNRMSSDMTVFNDHLYVGTFNWNNGAEMWRYGYSIYLPLMLRE
jgi:photosystem II stability/assembly factor-like uncharacterized protein